MTRTLAALVVRVPVEPDRDLAREWAVRELSGREYSQARPGLFQRAIEWLLDWLSRLAIPGEGVSPWFLVPVVAAIAVLALYAFYRSGGGGRARRRGSEPVLSDPRRTAADHRADADRHADAADYALAVVERFRAVARELEDRAVLAPQPGRTADEIASEAGRWLPGLQRDLDAGARTFDDVRYGEHRATAEMDAALRELDAAVRRARPAAEPVAAGGWRAP
jgi:hypothetical protein